MRSAQVNRLVDLAWKFGVTTSTDEVATVGSTFLQMKLEIEKDGARGNNHHSDDKDSRNGSGTGALANGEQRQGEMNSICGKKTGENVYIQLSLPQFYDFLGEMESAARKLQSLE